MTKIKRIILLLLALLFFVLTGCEKIDLSGGKTSDSAEQSAPTTQNGSVLTVKTTLTGSDAFRPQGSMTPKTDAILKQIKDVETQFGITVQVDYVSASDLATNFVSQTQAGNKYADLIQSEAQFLATQYKAGNLLSLEQAGLTPSESGVLTAVDGTPFALRPDGWMNPLPTASFLLFYNEKILTDGRIESPLALYEEGNWNWDNFTKLCDDIGTNTPDDIYSVARPTTEEPNLIWATLHAHGAQYFDEKGRCIMDSEETRTGFDKLKKLISSSHTYQLGSYINPTADPTAKLAFANRNTAFYVGNGSEFFDMSEDSLSVTLGEDLRIIGFPTATKTATGVSFTDSDAFLGIPSGADTELCKKVLPVLLAPKDGDDPAAEVINDYFYHEEDGALYFELLKNADTHSLLWAGKHVATVEELFWNVTNGGSAKEILSNLQTMFNEGKG